MKKALVFLMIMIFSAGIFAVPVAAQEVSVYLNGEKMQFDVNPVVINDRTMVPMRAIFEALGCSVSWDDQSQQAIGIKNGKKVVVAIGNTTASVGGKYVQIDQPAVLKNDRTLVPLRFISEAYGCKVDWDDLTHTVTITDNNKYLYYFFDSISFGEKGGWTRDGSALKGRTSRDTYKDAGKDIPIDETAYAKANIDITRDGTYRVWINARDYAQNQQGSRFFTMGIDDKVSDKTFGQHANEGYAWEDAGTFELTKGRHLVKLIDTSAFFARCNGVLVTNNLDFVPEGDASVIAQSYPAQSANPYYSVNMYPDWTKEEFVPAKTASIQNDKVKIEFYQGQASGGSLTQYAMFVNDIGNWVNVKSRTEESAYMLQRADESKYSQTVEHEYIADTIFTVNGEKVKVSTDNVYEMAPLSWCIPTDFEVIDENAVKVSMINSYATIDVIYELDDFAPEPKVTLNATFNQDGSYSFTVYNGDGVAYEDFDTVTAPLLFVKHALPAKPYVISEPFMFTPMNTLYYKAERNKKGNNKEFTSGLAVDPTEVRQGMSYPETAEYGTTFYTVDGKVRPQMIAPLMGDNNTFKAGDTFSFTFRILNDFGNWYDTFKHVGVDMFKTRDIRDNYYTSFNEAIYNATDLWLDDFYGGWDDKAMSYYNMEAKDVTTQADPLEAAQRYMLTDDLNILEERTVPTIAYMLSRGTMSFQYTDVAGGLTSSYIKTEIPSPIGKPVDYSAGVYGGLYEMTQGRMPYLLNYAVNEANSSQIPSIAALYRYTGDEGYYNMIVLKADEYMENTSCIAGENYSKMFTTGFVYTDYARLLNTLLLAYEYTGDKKYLEAADEAGHITMTSTWNVGYHNGYDYNTFVIDDSMSERPYPHDGNANFFWHGSIQWRLGNAYGEFKSPSELGQKIPNEEVPGWLPAQAGRGTEHPFTPRYGAINQLNVWAGSVMRLAHYTGDDYYVTQARNAMIGRFGNYPGYGGERYIVHNSYPDYPYTGPDYTGIYYHHIPVFMGMIEDYLINDVWYRSNAKIEFPMVFQQGYAYFDMNRYGQAAGKFYDEEDMWLWIAPNVVTPDNRSVDYIAARKDGTLGVAFVNEKLEDVTSTITLGSEISNASSINGTAVVYDADGNKSETSVTNGQFTITIPAKGIKSVVIKNENIKAPSYVREYKYSIELGQTVCAHTNGKGFVIQLSDEMYHAYTYVTDKDLKQLEITYTADGKTETKVCDSYPFEFIIKVEDVNSDFVYNLKATKADGTVADMGGGLLRTIDNSEGVNPDASVSASSGTYYSLDGSSIYTREKTAAPLFEATDLNINRIGRAEGCWKFIVEKSSIPFEVTESNVVDLKNTGVVMNWKHRTNGEVIDAVSFVKKAEMADNGERVALYVESTFALPASVVKFDNASYTITAKLYHEGPTDVKTGVSFNEDNIPKKIEFEPVEIKANSRGRAGEDWRYVVSLSELPFEVSDGSMTDMMAEITYTHKETGEKLVLENTIKNNEMRADGKSITIIVTGTDEVSTVNADGAIFDDAPYDIKFILSPAK